MHSRPPRRSEKKIGPTREAAKQVYNRGHIHPCQVDVKKGDLAMSLARQRLFTLQRAKFYSRIGEDICRWHTGGSSARYRN
jgi:hypothetical protein